MGSRPAWSTGEAHGRARHRGKTIVHRVRSIERALADAGLK
jgi:hypothetical protein